MRNVITLSNSRLWFSLFKLFSFSTLTSTSKKFARVSLASSCTGVRGLHQGLMLSSSASIFS